jgi:hypothetical protein
VWIGSRGEIFLSGKQTLVGQIQVLLADFARGASRA